MRESRIQGRLRRHYTFEDCQKQQFHFNTPLKEETEESYIFFGGFDVDEEEEFDIEVSKESYEYFEQFKVDQFNEQVNKIVYFHIDTVLERLKDNPPKPIALLDSKITEFKDFLLNETW